MTKRTRNPDTTRPYRLWDAAAKHDLRWRYYSTAHNAHNGALLEMRWVSKVGTTIEVYNCATGRLHGQYTRTPTSVTFKGA